MDRIEPRAGIGREREKVRLHEPAAWVVGQLATQRYQPGAVPFDHGWHRFNHDQVPSGLRRI